MRPADPNSWLLELEAYVRMGDLESAGMVAREAARIHPDEVRLRVQPGFNLLDRHDRGDGGDDKDLLLEAKSIFDDLHDRCPNSPLPLLGKGDVSLRMGEHSAAKASFSEVATRLTWTEDYGSCMRLALESMFLPPPRVEVIELLIRGAQFRPKEGFLHLYLGILLESEERPDAEAILKQAKKLLGHERFEDLKVRWRSLWGRGWAAGE